MIDQYVRDCIINDLIYYDDLAHGKFTTRLVAIMIWAAKEFKPTTLWLPYEELSFFDINSDMSNLRFYGNNVVFFDEEPILNLHKELVGSFLHGRSHLIALSGKNKSLVGMY